MHKRVIRINGGSWPGKHLAAKPRKERTPRAITGLLLRTTIKTINMKKDLTYKNVTKKDAEDLGVKFPLLKEWLRLMGEISQFLKDIEIDFTSNSDGFFNVGDFRITVSFINNDFLRLEMTQKGEEVLTVRHTGNCKIIFVCLACFLSVPPKN